MSLDVLLGGLDYDAGYALAFCDGGCTTNLPVAGLLVGPVSPVAGLAVYRPGPAP